MPQFASGTDLHPFTTTDMLPCEAPSFTPGREFDLKLDSRGLPTKFQSHDFYLGVKQRRQMTYTPAAPLMPADRCPRWVLNPAKYVCEDSHEISEVNKALKRLDPEFEVIYDSFTGKPFRPAYHLYRVIRGGYKGTADWMIYELSCHDPMDVPWNSPTSHPRKPDLAWVTKVAARMKTAVYAGMGAVEIHRNVMSDALKRQWEPTVKQAAKAADESNHMYSEVWSRLATNRDAKRGKRIARQNEAKLAAACTKVKVRNKSVAK